jgi:predicted phage terminase large subunit-like protein
MDLSVIKSLSPDEQRNILGLIRQLEELQSVDKAKLEFMPFVKRVWPGFIEGRHHKIMADAFQRIADGKLKRLIVTLGPRHSKSEFASYLLPAWFLGRYPYKKIIQASHTSELAVGFGRKVRNLVKSEDYQAIFPGTVLRVDSKAAGRWNTGASGEYFACGVGSAVTGRGSDLLIIDDPTSEQDAISGAYSNDIYKKTYEWYISGPRQRLQPSASIVIVMTRWSQMDLVGQLLKRAAEKDEPSEWEVIEFPAIMPSGQPLWPEFWSLEELLKVKADISLARWNAQYMQNPTSEEGAIIKRDWWKRWDSPAPPKCESILLSFDTAYLKTQRANYSACTTWGVFMGGDPDKPVPNLILLDAWRDKLEFPELKAMARKIYREKKPDMVIIESRAAGAPLIFELRAMGIPVMEFTPSRGQDKIARANAVTDLFRSGMVWAPETRWADDVIEECNAFPQGENDDYVDTVTQALLRFRQGGIVKTQHDEEDKPVINRRIADYY